jgi:predicted permease
MSFSELFSTFANNLLPVLLISAGGFTIGHFLSIDSRAVGRVVFYLFSPVLIFSLLIHNQLPLDEIARTVGLATGVVISTGVLTLLSGLASRLERTTLMAALLTTMFANNGNYGLPLVSFAFGKEALAHSSIYFVTSSLLFNTLGVLVASLGHLNFKQAALGLFRVPTTYAVILAVVLGELNLALPAPIDRTVSLVASGTIPLLLVLLGLELQRTQWTHHLRALSLSTSVRLLAGPLLGFGLSALLGLNGAALQAGVVEAAMPAAVSNTVLAGEYDLDSSLVTATIFLGTALSPLTLTPLIVLLGK